MQLCLTSGIYFVKTVFVIWVYADGEPVKDNKFALYKQIRWRCVFDSVIDMKRQREHISLSSWAEPHIRVRLRPNRCYIKHLASTPFNKEQREGRVWWHFSSKIHLIDERTALLASLPRARLY